MSVRAKPRQWRAFDETRREALDRIAHAKTEFGHETFEDAIVPTADETAPILDAQRAGASVHDEITVGVAVDRTSQYVELGEIAFRQFNGLAAAQDRVAF